MHANINVPHPQGPALPEWVPTEVITYLAHLEGGNSLRHIARKCGCHASTVLRQVRKTEGLRDDPLADAALSTLETFWRAGSAGSTGRKGMHMSLARSEQDKARLQRDITRALKALSEPRTLLVIAEAVEEAIVVLTGDDGRPVRRAIVARDVAEVLALREWIAGKTKGRLGRYSITAAGRAELNRQMAQAESQRAQEDVGPAAQGQGARAQTGRAAGAEAPLRVLARRKRGDGEAYLPRALVAAAERFHESFEIARVSGVLGEDLSPLLQGQIAVSPTAANAAGATTAQALSRGELALDHLSKAVRALGPDLAETVILAVCREWGMERVEEALDYPARSGKIVLRIALTTLARHYGATQDEGHDLIY